MTARNLLVGKRIIRIDLEESREAIRFYLSDGSAAIAQCQAECCSHTWIEDILDPEAALDVVLDAKDLALPAAIRQEPTKTGFDEDVMAYYGYAIDTTKGRCTLAYRNSSNGAYGGNLMWSTDKPYHMKMTWQRLVGDPTL